MQRKSWIAGLLVIAVALAGGIYLSRAEPIDPEIETDRGREAGGSLYASPAPAQHGPAREDDPAAPARGPEQTPRAPGAIGAPAVQAPRQDLQRAAIDAERSAGYRLGRTRSDIEVLEARLARFREALGALEAEGDPAVLERQRATIARFEARLEALRTDERELADEAGADGTIAEAEDGYAAGEGERARPEVRAESPTGR